jgi:hypothetical protein
MNHRFLRLTWIAAALFAASGHVRADEARSAAPADGKLAVADVIPLTIGNLRGHKLLYDEGWFVITSSRKALEYARRKSIVSSTEAIRKSLSDASRRAGALGRAAAGDLADSAETSVDIATSATARTAAIWSGSNELAGREFAYAEDGFKKAAESFVRGNVSLARRTEEDRRELAALPGNYFKDVKSDFSDVHEKVESARRRFAEKIDPAWEDSFRRASRDFKTEYDKSGDEHNSLAALGPILRAYLEAFYHGLAAPAAKTLVRAAAIGTSDAVFLPSAAATIVAGRTVRSAGLTVFYAGRTGAHLLSPTVEGGLLGGVALLSAGAVPLTYVGGAALGAVNLVAFTAAAPAVGSVQASADEAYDAGKYASLVVYDAGTGTTTVLIDQVESGVVLGYNALSAVPTQALLGGADTAVFLAWDGPRLLLAAARGRLKSGADGKEYSVGELPAGTVVNLKALGRKDGVTVEPVSTDPAVIQKVLEKIPADARAPDADR